MSLATLLSHPAHSVPCFDNIMTQVGTGHAPRSSRPDPNEFEAPHAPSFVVPVGSMTSFQVFSPITMSLSTSDLFSTRTGSPQRSYILTQRSSATPRLSSSMSVVLLIAGSIVLPSSSNSSDSVTHPPPPVLAPSSTSIKDKPSGLGIKPATDKESWINAKKIINVHTGRAIRRSQSPWTSMSPRAFGGRRS
jgi:hypothetical protein